MIITFWGIKKMKMFTFETTVQVNQERILDILQSGLEGGCDYWLSVNASDIIKEAEKYNGERNVQKQIMLGGNVNIYELEDPDNKLGILNLINIVRALQAMAKGEDLKGNKIGTLKGYFDDFINENDDAITADVIIQIAVMGEIVYG
jgi:hypothetical protein